MQFLIQRSRSVVVGILALAGLCSAQVVSAGWFDEPVFGPSDEKRLQQWTKNPEQKLPWGELDFVRLVERDGGVANAHPVSLDVKQVATALSSVLVKPLREERELFSDDEVKKLAPIIVAALKVAGPNQDLAFVVSGQHAWAGLIPPALTNSGRIFFADGKLNVLLGMLQVDVAGDKRYGSRQDPSFNLGARASATKGIRIVGVTEGEAHVIREDWIALTPGVAAAPAMTNAPAAGGTPANAATAVPAPTLRAPEVTQDGFYSKQEGRLRALQRMKDQGLLTDAEYQAKRAEILKAL